MEQKEIKMPNNQDQSVDTPQARPNETGGFHFEGHIKIHDPDTKEVFVDKRNAIHYENMSVAMVNSLSNQGYGTVYQMIFGTGGTTVDPTGLITYLTPNHQSRRLRTRLHHQQHLLLHHLHHHEGPKH